MELQEKERIGKEEKKEKKKEQKEWEICSRVHP